MALRVGCGGGRGGTVANGGDNCFFSFQQNKDQKRIVVHPQLQQRRLQQQQQQLLATPSLSLETNGFLHPWNYSYPLRSVDMGSLEEIQVQDIDTCLKLHREKLRLLIHQQKRELVRRLESSALPLLQQKDDDIAKASCRMKELECYLAQLEIENREWQRMAIENEAMVSSLSNTIENLKNNGSSCSSNSVDDAESCCDAKRASEDGGDEEPQGVAKMKCSVCKVRDSCVLFLPCRHLSSCKPCEEILQSCPVCQTAKKAIVEALMF